MEEQIAGGENADFMEIAGGDHVKMARLTKTVLGLTTQGR